MLAIGWYGAAAIVGTNWRRCLESCWRELRVCRKREGGGQEKEEVERFHPISSPRLRFSPSQDGLGFPRMQQDSQEKQLAAVGASKGAETDK